MKFGCCVGMEIDKIMVLQEAGYDYIELPVVGLNPEKITNAEFKELKKEILSPGLKPEVFNNFLPGDLKVTGPEVSSLRLTSYVETALERVAELGGEIVVFGSGKAREIPDGFSADEANSQIIEFCQFLAKEARKNEITVAIEPLNSRATNTVNTLLEGLKLVREVKQPEIKLLVDLFHLTEEDEPFDDIYQAQSELVHVHIPVPDIEGVNPYPKRFLHKKFFQYLKQIDYQGRITVEDNGGRFNNFATQVRQVHEYITKIWEEEM